MMYPGNPMGWGNSGWLWWMPMGLMMLLFWGLVIVVLILLVRWLWTQGQGRADAQIAETPLDVLKKRYARGEITKEEFDRIKQDIL
ncbi:MAG: SHOCT domain-containing protein [candidate division NC10 bacterium]|nr:SHOCT domain-containing protein [candidate division NC10 bacterium]